VRRGVKDERRPKERRSQPEQEYSIEKVDDKTRE
tara:strand:+ start:349 stop:450 length:102 start_codon:yes stop_codon:yes gene_type:complete